jgi:hypothetical protein
LYNREAQLDQRTQGTARGASRFVDLSRILSHDLLLLPQVGGAVVAALGVAGAAYGMKHHKQSDEEVSFLFP